MIAVARCLFALALAGTACGALADCPAGGPDRAALMALKAGGFTPAQVPVADALVLRLADCLGDPDPALRDGVAYAGLAAWLRADAVTPAARQALMERLLAWTSDGEPDPEGFRAPFAVLVLSEVVRTDRMAAWMTPAQRETLVAAAVRYLQGVRDYRGFVDGQGWRHGVAHGADLVMQLAINPSLDQAQCNRLLEAVAWQVAPTGHAYVHGESERLARPVLLLLRRGAKDEAAWAGWLASLSAPAPLASWADAYQSEAGLARRHNLRQFLLALYAGLREGNDPALQPRLPPVVAALRAVE